MSTANRGMDTVPSNSLQPSVPINADLLILDAAVYGLTTIEFTSDANRTLTAAEADCTILRLTDSPSTLTTGRDVVFPARFPLKFVQNATAQTLTLKKSGQAGVTLAAGADAIVIAGATDVLKFVGGGTFTGGSLSSALNEAKGSDIASAGTTDIGAATGNFVHVTGTTTITALGTVQAGTRRIVRFSGALTLTHNATSLILPTGANITTAANDCAVFVSEGSGNWRCVGYQRADGTALVGGAASLANWTEAVSTAAPNATIPVVSFTATNAATHVDVAIRPKGSSGGLAAHVADSTSTGGNKRGANAVDWQTNRTGATKVASGAQSVICGGLDNVASGNHSAIVGGNTNTASGFDSFVGGGSTNFATGSGASIPGGDLNTASGQSSNVTGGSNNTADAIYSRAGGGFSTCRGIKGADAYSCGLFSVPGDAQCRGFVLRSDTTNATPEAMTSDNSTAGTANQVVLPNNSAFTVTGTITARESGGNARSWKVEAFIVRGANAASTTLVAGGTPAIIGTSGGFTGTLAITADTTNGCLAITVTGVAATNIKWVASLDATEVVG